MLVAVIFATVLAQAVFSLPAINYTESEALVPKTHSLQQQQPDPRGRSSSSSQDRDMHYQNDF